MASFRQIKMVEITEKEVGLRENTLARLLVIAAQRRFRRRREAEEKFIVNAGKTNSRLGRATLKNGDRVH